MFFLFRLCFSQDSWSLLGRGLHSPSAFLVHISDYSTVTVTFIISSLTSDWLMTSWPGSLSPFGGPAISKRELVQLSKEVMGDMFNVIIVCAQDELDSLGWCICRVKKYVVYTEQTHVTLNHFKPTLHISRHTLPDVIFSHNMDIITQRSHEWLLTVLKKYKDHAEPRLLPLGVPSFLIERRGDMPICDLCIFGPAFGYILEQYTSMNDVIITGLHVKSWSYGQ